VKYWVYFIVFSILVAVAYGVVFSYAYPLVSSDQSLVSLFAILGAATCSLIMCLWNFIKKIVHLARAAVKEFPEPVGKSDLTRHATKLFDNVDLGSQRACMSDPITIFFSYSHKDEALRDELETHLKLLEREGVISAWYDRKILPGMKWDSEIDQNFEKAKIILLLISADFIASEYCWGREVQMALQRHESGAATVIPIILRSCDWQSAPFARLRGLPKEMKPVTAWADRDAAWTAVALGIRAVVERIRTSVRQG